MDIKQEIEWLALALRGASEDHEAGRVGVAEHDADGTVTFEVRTITGAWLKVTVEAASKPAPEPEPVDTSPEARAEVRARLDAMDPVKDKAEQARRPRPRKMVFADLESAARAYGKRHGVTGRQGGWLYNEAGWRIAQGWQNYGAMLVSSGVIDPQDAQGRSVRYVAKDIWGRGGRTTWSLRNRNGARQYAIVEEA